MKKKCSVSFSGTPDKGVRVFKALWFNADVKTFEARNILYKQLPRGETVTVEVESKRKAIELVVALRDQGLLTTYQVIRGK